MSCGLRLEFLWWVTYLCLEEPNLELPKEEFDGIFANAALFHIPSQELPRVLNELHGALRSSGILFFSNPRGNDEGWQGQRYGQYMELNTSQFYLEAAGFEILHHYYRPSGKPRHEQPWLAIVSRCVHSSRLCHR